MPRGGQYSVSVVSVAVRLVMNAATSIRGAAACLAELVAAGWVEGAMPCFGTVRSWILRLGLYSLIRPLDRSRPWLWIVDHSIQIGTLKLLVILGCPLGQVPFGERALRMSDLSLIALVPMEQSTGDLVERELEVAALRTGRPAQIASDSGSDLLKGIRQYRELRDDVSHVPDLAHCGANLLQRHWEADAKWTEFSSKLQATSAKLRQSKEACLMAPKLRLKSRFMNVRTQLRFSERVLGVLDGPSPGTRVEEHYGWLREYREELSAWVREQGLVATALSVLRVQGLHEDSLPECESAWGELGDRASTLAIAEELRNYVRRHRPQEPGVRRVASTEAIESSFGKLKRLEGDQNASGFTELSLALGAAVDVWDESTIAEALDAVPEKKVAGWTERTLGKTVQWFRINLLGQTVVPNAA